MRDGLEEWEEVLGEEIRNSDLMKGNECVRGREIEIIDLFALPKLTFINFV